MKHRHGVIVDVRNESWVVLLDQGLISRLAEKELWEQERSAMRFLCSCEQLNVCDERHTVCATK